MSEAERLSREVFYRDLVWVINGQGFEQNYDIFLPLPDPKLGVAADLLWAKATRQLQIDTFNSRRRRPSVSVGAGKERSVNAEATCTGSTES